MENSNYRITKLSSKDSPPFELLLLADETIEAIEKYIYASDVYLISERKSVSPIAAVALYKISDTEIEIKNIAVSEMFQNKGIGSYIINEIKEIVKTQKYVTMIVGTPDVSYRQIHFYEKNGFVKYDLKKDFFIKNYSEPIIEEGIILKDMVMLKITL